jgi:hypothetical protein
MSNDIGAHDPQSPGLPNPPWARRQEQEHEGKTENPLPAVAGSTARTEAPEGESGPPTYNIVTVRDFLAVPEDRIDACLHDFATFLRTAPHWAALLKHVCDEMHGPDKVDFVVGERFTWVDDDDHNMSFRVITPDGQSTDVLTLTPSDADAIGRNLDLLAEAEAQRATEAAAGSVVLAVDPSRSTPDDALTPLSALSSKEREP